MAFQQKEMGKANVKITGDSKGLKKELKSAQSGIVKFKTKAVGAFKATAIGIGVITAAAAAMYTATSRSLEKLDKIGKSAKNIGLTAEAFQELAHAADLSGVGVDLFQKSMAKLAKAAEDAKDGLATQIRAFDKMGISVDKLRHSDPEQLLEAVADGISAIEDPVQQTAIAMQIFGARGLDMLEMLKNGKDGLNEFREEARKLGFVLSNELIAASEENNDKLETMKKIVDAQWVQVWASFAPTVVKVSGAMADLVVNIKDLLGLGESTTRIRKLTEELERLQTTADKSSGRNKRGRKNYRANQIRETEAALKRELEAVGDEQGIRTKIARLEEEQAALEAKRGTITKTRRNSAMKRNSAALARTKVELAEAYDALEEMSFSDNEDDKAAAKKARENAADQILKDQEYNKVRTDGDKVYEQKKIQSLDAIRQVEIEAIDDARERSIAQVEFKLEQQERELEGMKITEAQKAELRINYELAANERIVEINKTADEEIEENRVKAQEKAEKERQKIIEKAAKETAARNKEVRESIGDIATDLATAAAEGTLSFDDMFESIIAGAIRAQIQIALMGKASAGGGGGGGLGGLLSMGIQAGIAHFSGGAATPAAGTSAGSPVAGPGGGTAFQNWQPRAGGGRVYAGRSYSVGELRGERFTPDRNGTIDPHPSNGGNSGNNISVNVNNSGEPKNAKVSQKQIGKEVIINVLLEDQEQNGKFSQQTAKTYGLKRQS